MARGKLWSINALADELGKDRRTLSKFLTSIPPDGKLNGNPAWRLQTVLNAINPSASSERQGSLQRRHPVMEGILDRLDSWEEIYLGKDDAKVSLDVENIASLYHMQPETVLTWLRAGMPYHQKGDWKTGKGFLIQVPQASDWITSKIWLCRLFEDRDVARRLGLEDKL